MQLSAVRTIVVMMILFCGPHAGFADSPTYSAAGPDDSVAIARLKGLPGAIGAAAVKQFWESVRRTGAPLIEPVAGVKGWSFVTFVWRGDSDTRNVVIFDGVAGFDAKDRMEQVAGTNIWYKTYRVRNDARFAYNLSPNDSLQSINEIKGDEAMKQRLAAFRADPLNPRHCPTTFGAYGVESSYVELPDAGPLLWSSSWEGVARGRLEESEVHSQLLNRDKKLWIYTPAGFKKGSQEYPLLVLFDGDRNSMWMPKVLDLMIARGQIPPIVAVMTDESTPSIRNSELPCNPQFADFLARELVPWVRARYGVTASPAHTIVAGASYGGLASVFAGMKHPEVFGNVIALSGSFFWKPEGTSEAEWLTRFVGDSPKLPLRFYLEVGLMEDFSFQVARNRDMKRTLMAKKYPVGYEEFDGGHSFLTWSQGMVHGLSYMLR